jgi:CSLREA domain-containing protein
MKRAFGTLAVLAMCASGAAQAATFTVTTTADLPDLIPGNGFCNVFPQPGPGPCTLRAAIIETNALAGADAINLAAGARYELDIEGAGEDAGFTGDLDVSDDLQVRFLASGERPVVDANGIDRVFDVISGTVTFLGFDVTGGGAIATGTTSGGGILVRSASERVTLSLMRVYFNRALLGGGLYNLGHDTTILASEFSYNIFVGDINETPSGSAIRNRGNLEIGYSSFHGNSGFPPKRTAAPLGDTETANAIDSEPQGAGTGALRVFNTTMAANLGNAINADGAASLDLSSVTLAGNSVRGLRMAGSGGSLLMHNSIIAHNTFADCFLSDDTDLDLDRYNLDSDDSCHLSGGTTNRPGVDPQLTPLAYHGGVTPVSWPLTSSIAIDHGHPLFTANGCEDDDQQFVDRPVDFDGDGASICDLGAVEMERDVIFFDPFDRL